MENPIKKIIYDDHATEQLPDVLAEFTAGRRVMIFADIRTFAVAGRAAEESLLRAGWTLRSVVVPDPAHGSPVCDDLTFNQLKPQVKDADILLAVGGGVISDLVKWLAFDLNLPYATLATAASMNGYTAANVAPTLKGVKSIVYARAPRAVLAVPEIIQNAPFELTAAGLGDVIAKPISTADWLLNHHVFGEPFDPEVAEMITKIEPAYSDHPENVRDRDPKAIEALFMGLIYSGIAMTVIGTSAPASGGEHMLSHTLDMMSLVDGVPHDLHGRQVGLGTILAAALYEKIFQRDHPRCVPLPQAIDHPFWGHIADPVAEQYQLKQPLMETMRLKIEDPAFWNRLLSAARKTVRPPQAIKNCLKQAGAAHTYPEIKYSRDRIRQAVLHMHEIRKRPTVVDLAWLLGILPAQTDDLIDQWLS